MRLTTKNIAILLTGLLPLATSIYAKNSETRHPKQKIAKSFASILRSIVSSPTWIPAGCSLASTMSTYSAETHKATREKLFQESKAYLASGEITQGLQAYINHAKEEIDLSEKTDQEIVEELFIALSQD